MYSALGKVKLSRTIFGFLALLAFSCAGTGVADVTAGATVTALADGLLTVVDLVRAGRLAAVFAAVFAGVVSLAVVLVLMG